MPTITKYSGKRGTTWQVRIRRHGKEQSASFPTRKMAEEWSRKIEYELDRDTYLPEHKPTTYHTVNELIDVYCERILPQSGALTQRKSRYRLSWWRDVLEDTNVLSVTTAMIEEYKHMLSKRLANGTVNLYLRTLSPVFTFAASPRLGWIPRSPFQDVRLLPVKGRMPLVTNDEIQRLLDCCMQSRSKYLHLYVRLMLATGAGDQRLSTYGGSRLIFARGR